MEINENELGKVAGGKVVETKEGKFIVVLPHTKEFETQKEAEEAEKFLPKPYHFPDPINFQKPGAIAPKRHKHSHNEPELK